MCRKEETSDFIPIDLIVEIFSRLPTKSIARFCCVSNLWRSILHRPYFTELFLTRSLARPRLLFAVEGNEKWSFFSLPQAQNPVYEKSSSLVVAVDFHIWLPRGLRMYLSTSKRFSCGYASGLVYLSVEEVFDFKHYNVFYVAMTSTGEIVLSEKYRYKVPFYVFYFNPERNTLQHVEIKGIDENRRLVYTFVDHVEDLNVHDPNLLMSSMSAPSVKNKRSGQSSWRASMNH